MTQMTAKYTSRCAACGGLIQPGDKIEWEQGHKARHAECPKAGTILNAAYQPKGETARTNKRPTNCSFCGSPIAVGKGNLWWGEDGCCSNPRHFDEGGWHVTCFDRDACEQRVQQAREDAADAKAKRAAALKPYDDARREVEALLRRVDLHGTELSGEHETITLVARAAGSKCIYVYAEGVTYAQSSYDDDHAWTMPATHADYPALMAAIGRLKTAIESAHQAGVRDRSGWQSS